MVDLQREIINTLNNNFNIKVYGEGKKQDFAKPSFSVREIDRQYYKQVGGFIRTNYQLLIEYFPTVSKRQNTECRTMGLELLKIFNFYEDLKLHPTEITHEIHDEVLQFHIDFSIRYEMVDNSPLIRHAQFRSEIK